MFAAMLMWPVDETLAFCTIWAVRRRRTNKKITAMALATAPAAGASARIASSDWDDIDIDMALGGEITFDGTAGPGG